MEHVLQNFAVHVALALEGISIVVIALGGVEAAYRVFWPFLRRQVTQGLRRAAWLSLARWLVLGLEFMLAADIVRTVVDPTWEELGELGATALIRTFLNYFLERDLEAAERVRETHEQPSAV
jgi:uncharacterized membrane protein